MKIPSIHSKNGFTLFEVLAVFVLISIFTVLAIVQYSAMDATLTAQAQVLAAHIRYARMRSMNTDLAWGIYYHHNPANSGDCYYLLFNGGAYSNSAPIAPLPGETQDRVDIGDMGITIASAVGSNALTPQSFEVRFDDWGRPTSRIGASDSMDTLRLRLTKSGQAVRDLAVTKNTGFIQQ